MHIIGWNLLSVVSAFRRAEISQQLDQYSVIPFAGTQSKAATGIPVNKSYPPKVIQPKDFTTYRATVKQFTTRASNILKDVPSRCTPTLYADVNDYTAEHLGNEATYYSKVAEENKYEPRSFTNRQIRGHETESTTSSPPESGPALDGTERSRADELAPQRKCKQYEEAARHRNDHGLHQQAG
jgi:hypothetical protein